jgi:hypothetical protein
MGILCSKSIQEWLHWIQTEENTFLTTNLTKWELGGNQVTAEMLINHSPPHCAPIVSWWCQTKKLGANYRVDAISSYYQRGLIPKEKFNHETFVLLTQTTNYKLNPQPAYSTSEQEQSACFAENKDSN